MEQITGAVPKHDNVRSAGGMLAVFAQPVQRSIAKQMTLGSMFICRNCIRVEANFRLQTQSLGKRGGRAFAYVKHALNFTVLGNFVAKNAASGCRVQQY